MSQKEVHRLEVMQKLSEKRLRQAQASDILGINLRHVKRLYKQYKAEGAKGLLSKRRGKPSNRKLPESLKETAIALILKHYHDFGPTFANEKLREIHGLRFSTTTLRGWMIEAKVWIPRAERGPKIHQPRYRRPCFGELVQIDGSDHPWFEDRAPRCSLLVYVDDATSDISEMRFVPSESTFTYFEATKTYIGKYGKPVAFYSDKFSVFKVNAKNAKGGDKLTQFGRALVDLNIDIIHAHSPQAKGRVERTNQTLQDRLIKEMRLKKISNMRDGNAYLPIFIDDYNKRFGKAPLSNIDMHRPLQNWEEEGIDDIFCWQEDRTLSNNLTLKYDKRTYIIQDSVETRKLRKKRVTVFDHHNGIIKIVYKNKELAYRVFDQLQRVNEQAIVENKRLGEVLFYIKKRQDLRNEQRSKSCPKRYPLEYLAN